MRTLKILLAVVVLAVVGLVTAPSANAARTSAIAYVYGGEAYFRDNYWLRYCDTEVDGAQIRAHTTINGSHIGHVTRWAPSGGCLEDGLIPGAAVWFRVCTQLGWCSAWTDR